MESRFSLRRFAPFERVESGDIILLKRSSGPITGICRVVDAWFYHLDAVSWITIRKEYMAVFVSRDPVFWERRRSAAFASLVRIADVRTITPVAFHKGTNEGGLFSARAPRVTQVRIALTCSLLLRASDQESVSRRRILSILIGVSAIRPLFSFSTTLCSTTQRQSGSTRNTFSVCGDCE